MKEYTLKRENDEILLTGVFDSEQQAWNIMCVKIANRVTSNERLFLYDSRGGIIHADKAFEVWRDKRDLVEYELNIAPGIYNYKESFSKDATIKEVWEVMRNRAINNGQYKDLIAHLKLNGEILIRDELKNSLPNIITKVKEKVKTIDLLSEITKIKI